MLTVSTEGSQEKNWDMSHTHTERKRERERERTNGLCCRDKTGTGHGTVYLLSRQNWNRSENGVSTVKTKLGQVEERCASCLLDEVTLEEV